MIYKLHWHTCMAIKTCKLNQKCKKVHRFSVAITLSALSNKMVTEIKGIWCRKETGISVSQINGSVERTLSTGCLSSTVTGCSAELFIVLSKGMQVREEGQGRTRWRWSQPASQICLQLCVKPAGQCTLSHHLIVCMCVFVWFCSPQQEGAHRVISSGQ